MSLLLQWRERAKRQTRESESGREVLSATRDPTESDAVRCDVARRGAALEMLA